MRRTLPLALLSAALLLPLPALADATQWTLDPVHTEVTFEIPYMMISSVDGRFLKFKGTVTLDPKNVTASKVDVHVAVSSIDTGNTQRDKHLRSKEFFWADKYPDAHFVSTKVTADGAGYDVQGNLTIRGVTKPVTLKLSALSPAITDPAGHTLRATKATVTIDRKAFGVDWNKTLDSGGVVVGDKAKLTLKVILIKQE